MTTTLNIYDFDDTLAHQEFNINGQNVRLPKLCYYKFCEELRIEDSESRANLHLFKSLSDISALERFYYCDLQTNSLFSQFRSKLMKYISQRCPNPNFQQFCRGICHLRVDINLKVLEQYQDFLSLTSLGQGAFAGGPKVQIITNSYEAVVARYLKLLGIGFSAFNILGSQGFLEFGTIGKPDAKVLDYFLGMHQIQPDNYDNIIYHGDSSTDKTFANNCGIGFQVFDPHNEKLKENSMKTFDSRLNIS